MTVKLSLTAFLLSASALTVNAQDATYEAGIVCPNNKNVTARHNFSAANDMAAQNEVNRMLRSSSAYAGKGCQVVELRRRDSAVKPTAKSADYDLGIVCPGNRNVTNRSIISATSDLEAQNEAARILRSRSDYAGKGCEVVELQRR